METTPPTEPPEAFVERMPDPQPAPFWSPWATVGWGFGVSIAFVIIQTLAVVVWGVMRSFSSGISDAGFLAEDLAMNGDVVALGSLATGILGSALVVFLAAVKRGSRPRESLGLLPAALSGLARWIAITIGFIVASDALTAALGKPIVPEFMREIIHTTSAPALLWLAIIIASPFFEELFVRGFLLEGLRRGSMGDAGAIVLTSLFWASIHIQYGLYEIGTIFIFGLVLGLARIASRSLWVPIAMHMTANFIATIEAALGF